MSQHRYGWHAQKALRRLNDASSKPRYKLEGECNRCGDCCIGEECEHLALGGIATCKIHNSPNYPEKCKLYPFNPPITFKGCSYYFIDTWENNKIVRGKL